MVILCKQSGKAERVSKKKSVSFLEKTRNSFQKERISRKILIFAAETDTITTIMEEKTYKLSLQQLNDLVSDAVNTAIRKLDNLEIIDDADDDEAEKKGAVEVTQMDDEQYREAMDTMARNRGAGDEPKVGIFWYNATRKELFGVVTHKRTDYLKPNAGGGLITCSEMHEDVWKKELRRQKYHGDGTGPFKGEYQMKPRGRVFFSPADDQYIIAVGTWIDHSPEAIDQIIVEFDLPREKTIVKKASHWDIGQTWND